MTAGAHDATVQRESVAYDPTASDKWTGQLRTQRSRRRDQRRHRTRLLAAQMLYRPRLYHVVIVGWMGPYTRPTAHNTMMTGSGGRNAMTIDEAQG